MEALRKAARDAHQRPTLAPIPDSVLNNTTLPAALDQLWREISAHSGSDKTKILENLLIAQAFLRSRPQESLSEEDRSAINSLYGWASGLALPSPVFAESPDEPSSEAQDESRQRSTWAVSIISLLAALIPVNEAEAVQDIIIALASFTSETEPWTTHESYTTSTALLKEFVERSEPSSFWRTIESILKTRIRPLFAKTKNPAITESGRKNFHPIPLTRFDLSILDPESKPWRMHDVYITTAFSWIINQYKPTDLKYLEAHFPLLVPAILALIDDDSLAFKRHGCILLSQFLIPIRESKSDILRRTNLSSVFEDAIRPCFHSLPTITPEEDSIQLLTVAYPALRSLLQTSYRPLTSAARQPPPSTKQSKDTETFISTTTKTLREHLIPSFHHISSTDPTSASTFASFPHPHLSALLLNQIAVTCTDLGIHTTKYLQDIIPLLYSTLSNPFGTANPLLLTSAASAAQAVILNAHPRIWRWRGELLSAVCSSWLHILEDEEESAAPTSSLNEIRAAELGRLKKEIQGTVYLLRYALENPTHADSDLGQRGAKEEIGREIQMLVDADEKLRGCLLAEVDPEDANYFAVGLNGTA